MAGARSVDDVRASQPERYRRIQELNRIFMTFPLGYTMVLCGSGDGYRGRIEKVRFGVRIEEAFHEEIPATLLVLLLKINKEGPTKKDIWRAPGNHAQIRALARYMRDGALVNIANFDEKTVASVIKMFLSKIPGGIFGLENEKRLFEGFPHASSETQRALFCRAICSLCTPSQHLLVLLFGTFHMISKTAENDMGVKMTPDALGISVAPSLFHSCIHMRQAKMEDVIRSKVASEVISKIIQSFGYRDLFPQECYEFYARMTGRTMRLNENGEKIQFTLPNNTHDWPVSRTSPFSMKPIKRVGGFSLSSIAKHEKTNSFNGRMLNLDSHCASTRKSEDLINSSMTTSKKSDSCAKGVGFGCTYFGTGPEPVTVATICDELTAEKYILGEGQSSGS